MVLHFGLILISFLFFYVLQMAATQFVFPQQLAVMDTGIASQTIFATEPRLAVYGREPLSNAGRHIVFVGASNVREGYRPGEVSRLLSGVEISNMAVGASDMVQIRQLTQLALAAVAPKDLSKLTIVMGIWYGSFVDKERRWKGGVSDVEAEMLRYGLYSENGHELPRARLDSGPMRFALQAIRPFMIVSHGYLTYIVKPARALVETLGRSYSVPGNEQGVVQASASPVLSDAEKDRAVAFWENYMGPPAEWSHAGFDVLSQIVREVSATNATLVIVDMPIPAWHRERVPYDAIYQERLMAWLGEFSAMPGVSYVSMRDGVADEDYYDSAHPRPEVTRIWAARIARVLERTSRE